MNKTVVGGVVFIAAAAIARQIYDGKPITRVLVGAWILLLLLGVLEIFGGPANQLATAFVAIAVLVTLIDVVPWQVLLQALGLQTPTGGTLP